jgi:DNA polymerase III sliding clamp (beta) subunit (PCNA family)
MTKVVFEVASIGDSLKKVARCIPAENSGYEFGTSGGIVIEVRPNTGQEITVRGTNTELYYTEWVNALEISGPAVDWRLPSRFADLMASLPIGSGYIVELNDETGVLRVDCGKMSGTLRLIPTTGYPIWGPFDETNSAPVAGFGDRIAQVGWACHKIEEPLTGIYMDGQSLVASNRHVAVRVPCEIPAFSQGPVVAPAKLLGAVIRHSGDVRVGILTQIAVMPDEYTQIRCVTFASKYPNVQRALITDYETSLYVPKEQLMESVQRLDKITKSKTSLLRVMIGGGQVALMMRGLEKEEIFEDAIELANGGAHTPVMMSFEPKIFLDGISKGPDERVELHYNVSNPSQQIPVYMTGGGGYEAWFMQRASTSV